ncbi:MAG: LysM peptidoglycan-binding domain-containing protein [candidate division WOR-3 bacterium]|nr:LysM peptidoglycan-binding domain-containing protein [candidate division WOR-3 bacterium]
MTFTLESIPLPVEEIGIVSPQKVVWLSLPCAPDISQDWGPGQKTFNLSGRLFRADGSWQKAFEIDALKKRRQPLLFRFGENSFQVQVEEFRYQQSSGILTYNLTLVETLPLEQFIFSPAPEIRSFDLSRHYFSALRLYLTFTFFLGISDRISVLISDITARILEIENLLKDVIRLSQLPATTISQIAQSSQLILASLSSLTTEFEDLLFSSSSKNSESVKQALLYARAIRIQMSLLNRACISQPANYYTVQQGDTLPRIALTLSYQRNTQISWTEIARLNKLIDPGSITPGMQLLIP